MRWNVSKVQVSDCGVNPAQVDLWLRVHWLLSRCVLSPPEPPGLVGVSGCAAGQKGPGRQCSLAFLLDHNHADRRPIKGLLPLELRGSRRGITCGSLKGYGVRFGDFERKQ